MYTLSDAQIDYILNDIRARGVEMEDLQYNLLDHICCIIEQNLEVNGDFDSFYSRTVKQFYKHELWEIEEETISLQIFKHYYTMKKIMIGSGIASAFLMIAGIIFKFMHWPGAGMLIVLGIGSSSLIFLPLLLTLKIREKSKTRDKIIVGIGTLSGILFSLGILFKVMHWPGANMMGMGAIMIMLIVYLPVTFITGIRNPETKVNTIVSSIIIIMGCGLFLTLVNSRPSIKIQNSIAHSNQQVSDAYNFLSSENALICKQLENDSSEIASQQELMRRADEICKLADDIKLRLLSFMEGTEVTRLDYKNISDPDNFSVPDMYLFDNSGNPKKDLAELKKQLEAFNAFVSSEYKVDAKKLIDLSDGSSVHYEGKESWEKSNFYNTAMSLVMKNLSQVQLDVRILEASCCSRLAVK